MSPRRQPVSRALNDSAAVNDQTNSVLALVGEHYYAFRC